MRWLRCTAGGPVQRLVRLLQVLDSQHRQRGVGGQHEGNPAGQRGVAPVRAARLAQSTCIVTVEKRTVEQLDQLGSFGLFIKTSPVLQIPYSY